MSQNNQNGQKPSMPPKKRIDFGIIIIIILMIYGAVILFNRLTATPTHHFHYVYQFEERFLDGQLSNISARPLGGQNSNNVIIRGRLVTPEGDVFNFEFRTTLSTLNRLIDDGIAVEGEEAVRVPISITEVTENFFLNLFLSLLPFILIIGLFIFINRGAAGGNNKAFDFGKSRAKLSNSKNVTFKDVAGADEEKEELIETVDFLKNPKKYEEMGARIPKGILLSGPPGTGKTLLAKACAGEANVPFFTISGSDFVEMFVGVGASRVRDLFKQAKAAAPCIIFIDEIDAVGRQRGSGSNMGGGHSESEQTLNQLLVEMDGFSPNVGIIVMAATNRPDILDKALLRPGRFDRQITINAPDVKGREEVLKVHARNKKLDPSVKLDQLAQRIPGFSGADIENLLNEAALLAARDNRKVITIEDLDEATDRVMMGPAKKTRKISDKEKNTIAHHEAGHAVIGLKLDNANIVQKVTIIPRGKAGGYALMLPEEEGYLETDKSLKDRITGYLGGRVAEAIMFDEVSTGASHDFQMATRIARAMVTEYGMSDLGPIQYEQSQGRDYYRDKNFSDQIALEIDKETRKIVEDCYQIAKDVLTKHKGLMQNIAKYLIKVETLTRADIDEIDKTGTLKRAYPQEVIEEEKEPVKNDEAKSEEVVTEDLTSDN